MDRKIEKRQRRRFIDCDNRKFARKDSISLKRRNVKKVRNLEKLETRCGDNSEFQVNRNFVACFRSQFGTNRIPCLQILADWLLDWIFHGGWRKAINVIKFCAIQISGTIINTGYKIKPRSEHVSYYRFVQYNFDIEVIFESRFRREKKKSTLKSFDNRSNNIVRLKLKIRWVALPVSDNSRFFE